MRQYILFVIIYSFSALFVHINAQTSNVPLKKLYNEGQYYQIINKFAQKDKKTLSPQDLVYVGWAFYMLDDVKRAKEYADYAIQKDSTDSHIYYLGSLIAQSENKSDEALDYAFKAIEQDSTKGDYYTIAGNIYLDQNDTKKAIEFYKKGISAPIASEQAYYMLADTYDVIGEHKKALLAFYEAKDHTPKNKEQYLTILFSIGSLEMDNKQYIKAIAAFSELVKYYPDDYQTYVRLVQCCYALGDYVMGDVYKEKLYTAYQDGLLIDGEFSDRFCVDNFMADKKLISAYEYFQSVVSENATNVPIYIFYVVNEIGIVEAEIQYNYIADNNSSTYRLSVIKTNSPENIFSDFAKDMDYQKLKKLVQNTVLNGYVISNFTFK